MSVFVRASCYEPCAVVQTIGESEIGDRPKGIMFSSGTAPVLLTVLMMACIHTVFTVSTNTRTHSYLECFLKNKRYCIKAAQLFYKTKM